ncbi:MAG TPA: phage shock protein PspA [Chitinispirillaceae bacterium]|nr:phage shock protein PspA [Chitinispirillaceae bacterium]
MGIFSRFKDIVSSNINAMLDKAEDPRKMIRMMIQEMEETLIELKSGCASALADSKHCERDLGEATAEVEKWQSRAKLAVEKAREDLAREAILEKQNAQKRVESLQLELRRIADLVASAQDDILKLEGKIEGAREKQRLLEQRYRSAQNRIRAEQNVRRAKSTETVIKFEEYEHKIDRMEAEAGLINPTIQRRDVRLEEQFSMLENDNSIERELQELRSLKGENSK